MSRVTRLGQQGPTVADQMAAADADRTSAFRVQQDARQGAPKVYTDFTTKPDGAVPLVTDSGHPVILTRTSQQGAPLIENGKYVAKPTSNLDGYATYYQVGLGAGGIRVGCTYTVPADSEYGTTTAIGLWGAPLWENGYGGPVPQSRAHLVVNPGVGTWVFGIFDGTGTVCEIATGSFTVLPYDDTTIWRQELFIDSATGNLHISLPDESIAVVTAAQVVAATTAWNGNGGAGWSANTKDLRKLLGQTAFVEHFAASNGLAYIGQYPNFLTFWADTTPIPGSTRAQAPTSVGQVTKADSATLATAREPNPGAVAMQWAPATDVDIVIPAYPGTAIAGAPTVTAKAGANGRLIVEATGWISTTTAASLMWELQDGFVSWPSLRTVEVSTVATRMTLVNLRWVVNVGANNTRTFVLHHFVVTGAGTLKVGITYPLSMTVRPTLV